MIWVDETHLRSRDLNYNYAYTLPGQSNVITLPFSQNINCTFIVAMSYTSVISVYYKEASDNGCNAIDYIDFLDSLNVLEGSIILQDNAAIHTSDLVQNYQSNKNLRVIKSVPYSCDFNPIELLFNVVKKNSKNVQFQAVMLKNNLLTFAIQFQKKKLIIL